MLAWMDAGLRRGRGRVGVSVRSGGVLALGLGLGWACTEDPGPSAQFAAHCSDEAGNATCAQAYPSRPFCSLCFGVQSNEGCVSSPPPPVCVPGGISGGTEGGAGTDGTSSGGTTGDGTTSTAQTDTLAADGTTSTGSGTQGVASCEGDGTFDPACSRADPSRPFCIAGVCADCMGAGGDAFCGELEATTPACDVATGACLACSAADRPVCGETTPVCDTEAGACVPCTQHSDCGETACHRSAADPLQGACFLPEESVWVDGTAPCPGLGTEANPSCSLAAVAAAVPEGEARLVFLLAGDPYTEDIVVSQAATVAIVGVGSPSLLSGPGTTEPTLAVSGGALVYLSNIRVIDNATQDGIVCQNAVVSLSDSEVAGNRRWGVLDGGPCQIELHRTTLHHNEVGGVRMLGGHLTLDNATIAENGDGLSGPGVLLLTAGLTAVYATIAGNDGVGPDTLQCEGQVVGTIRNSILHGAADESVDLDCFTLVVDNSAVDSSAFNGGTNVDVGAYVSGFFTNAQNGDFRLAAPPLTPYGDVAQWQDADPRLDADGTERPIDALGYAGIDEP